MVRPRRPLRGRGAYCVVAAVVAADAVSLVLRWIVWRDPVHGASAGLASAARAMFAFAVAAVVGALIVERRPDNRTGRVLLALGASFAALSLVEAYARYGLLLDRGPTWAATAAGWASLWTWIPVIALLGALLLVFPDGRPRGRWRLAGWGLGIGTALLLASFPFVDERLDDVLGGTANPLVFPSSIEPVGKAVAAIGYVVFLASVFGAAVSVVWRWRGAGFVERQQLKWVAIAAVAFGAALVANAALESTDLQPLVAWIADACLAAIFVAIGVAVLRYRLYDVDVVINRAIVYTVLIAFVTAAYVVLVVGIGRLIGRTSATDIWLSVLATTIVALTFAPMRARAQRLANRLVYGETTSPYDVLADLGRRLAGALSPDDLLPSLARSAASGVGASAAEVRLVLPDGSERAVAWPDGAELDGDSLVVVPVTNGADLLGHITVAPRPGASLTRSQRGLITDLARQAAAPLSNVQLALQLEAQLDHISSQAAELQASRERLVRAQDDERRRIERDIHDGAQQQLVAVALELLAASRRAPEPLSTELDVIRRHVGDILATVRDLARGIFPPLLAEAGLGATLRAHLAKTHPGAELDDRLPAGVRAGPDVEAATYFCCLEALQNVTKHATGATTVTVSLELVDGCLAFEVTDNGTGFDPDGASAAGGTGLQGMSDRLAAIGGQLEVRARHSGGTSVRGMAPIRGGASTTTPA
jgi:signal transduction histidine kinase